MNKSTKPYTQPEFQAVFGRIIHAARDLLDRGFTHPDWPEARDIYHELSRSAEALESARKRLVK